MMKDVAFWHHSERKAKECPVFTCELSEFSKYVVETNISRFLQDTLC